MYRIMIMLLTAAVLSLPLAGCGGAKKPEQKPQESSVLQEGSETTHEAEHPTGEAGSGTEGAGQEHPTPSKQMEGSGTQ